MKNRSPSRRALTGTVLWEGSSQLTGEPVACIATFRTDNAHTGPMVQSWIIASNVDPITAVKTGADEAVCGDCPLRGVAKGDRWESRGCHIVPLHGPQGVYRRYVAGLYPRATEAILRRHLTQQMLRMGTYGDPVAVPHAQWEWALGFARGHTGYTHAWRLPIAQQYRYSCMASVECEADAREAVRMGWRYFRIRRATDRVARGEAICPKSDEAGATTNCFLCGACDGWRRKGQSNIVIIAHGSRPSLAAANRVLDRLVGN